MNGAAAVTTTEANCCAKEGAGVTDEGGGVLVQSGEQRHRSDRRIKVEARIDEGGGDRGGEGPEQTGIMAAVAPGRRPPPPGGCWSDNGRRDRRP